MLGRDDYDLEEGGSGRDRRKLKHKERREKRKLRRRGGDSDGESRRDRRRARRAERRGGRKGLSRRERRQERREHRRGHRPGGSSGDAREEDLTWRQKQRVKRLDKLIQKWGDKEQKNAERGWDNLARRAAKRKRRYAIEKEMILRNAGKRFDLKQRALVRGVFRRHTERKVRRGMKDKGMETSRAIAQREREDVLAERRGQRGFQPPRRGFTAPGGRGIHQAHVPRQHRSTPRYSPEYSAGSGDRPLPGFSPLAEDRSAAMMPVRELRSEVDDYELEDAELDEDLDLEGYEDEDEDALEGVRDFVEANGSKIVAGLVVLGLGAAAYQASQGGKGGGKSGGRKKRRKKTAQQAAPAFGGF